MDDPNPTTQRRLIAGMGDYELLGLSKLGTLDERNMALAEIEIRAVATQDTVMSASARLVAACDQLDALDAITDLDNEIAREQQTDRKLARR